MNLLHSASSLARDSPPRQILKFFDFVDVRSIVLKIDELHPLEGSDKGQEARDRWFGKIFGPPALITFSISHSLSSRDHGARALYTVAVACYQSERKRYRAQICVSLIPWLGSY